MTDNEKYVRRGQALIIGDDPQKLNEVMSAGRSKAGTPLRYAELPFAALAVVKLRTDYRVDISSGWRLQTTTKLSHAVVWIPPIQIQALEEHAY